MKFQICILALIFANSCVPIDKLDSIWIKNESNAKVYFYASKNQDTLLPQTNEYVIPVESKDRMSLDSNQPWEEVFTTRYPKDTMLIFFFNSDTINKYDWATIVKDYKVMERRTYSKSDLVRNNWTITYP